MPPKKIRLLSVAMAAVLVFTGATAAAIANTGHAPTRAALAANMASSPPVNLDNCPTLAEGYHGGCVNQLQTELNAIMGLNLSVDGTFASATYDAVRAFQQKNGINPDGIVGPATNQALDTGWSSCPLPPLNLYRNRQTPSIQGIRAWADRPPSSDRPSRQYFAQ